jgi:tetratricopeptide (TPR) repeat protein
VPSAGGLTDEYLAGYAGYYAKDFERAVYHLARAVAENSDNADAYYLLARAQWRRGDLKSALGAFQNVVRLQPGCAPALADLAGLLLEDLGNVQSAEKFSRHAIEADPLYAPGFVIQGNVRRARGDDEGAAQCYRQAASLNPGLTDPLINLGVLSLEAGDTAEALALFERGLALDPSHANGLWSRGNLLLLLGRLREGWPGYEQRFQIRGKNTSRPDPARARVRWEGSRFDGKTLLVYCEQGLGDTLQFVRYLPLVRELGGTVIFECQDELRSLLGKNFTAKRGDALFDLAIPLLSLPGIFRTSGETIPCDNPYILPDPAIVSEFKGRFDPGKFNVGIVWAGNPSHPNDGNRSCPPAAFEVLGGIPGVQLYSLQKNMKAPATAPVIDLAEFMSDFDATAGIMEHCDLLVTVDTAVAHLAGAMGKPVWVLLPHMPDWRWQLGREDSPWYPTMRLFRQSVPGDWSGVMNRVAAALMPFSKEESMRSVGSASAHSGPSRAASLFALGSTHFESGDNDGALRCFREALLADSNHAESRNALGVVLAARGELESAASEIVTAIALEPGRAEAHYNLGNVRKQQGNLDESAECYRAALAIDPGFLQAHVNLGCVLNEQGDPPSALEEYRNALALDPTSSLLLKHVGSLCLVLHDDEGALQAYERALRTDPDDPAMCHRAGSLRQSRGDLDEAIQWYRRALSLNPDLAETWSQLGTALVLKKLPEEAYRALENALRIKPDFPEVLNNMGMVMKERGQVEIAEKCFRMAIRSRSDYSPAYNNLGTVFLESSRFAEAADQFLEATRLSPDYHLAWNNLGNALSGLGKFHEAKQIYRAVISEDPTIPEVHFNLATALQHEHRFAESVMGYDEALRLRPGYAEARLNRALVLLLKGELEEGWRGYECRFSVRDPRRAYVPPGPEDLRWDGSDIRGKRILVRPEQGFGDTIQFARYIPMLAERGASILFECPKELCSLFRGFPGVDTLIEFRAEPPSLPFDRYVQLLSLPGLLGTHTVGSIPWPGPYIQPDPAAVESVRGRFDDGMFNVGIVWGGNPVHRNDYNRSCSLNEFLQLLDLPGVRFFSLQKGKPVSQLDSLPAGVHVVNLEPLLADFSMTAAVLAHLDLVIAVDTSVAHLAGAMGRAVWTLLPFRPDWRWLLDRTDSPWYPDMKLFRQSAHGDWAPVFRDVRSNLQQIAGK